MASDAMIIVSSFSWITFLMLVGDTESDFSHVYDSKFQMLIVPSKHPASTLPLLSCVRVRMPLVVSVRTLSHILFFVSHILMVLSFDPLANLPSVKSQTEVTLKVCPESISIGDSGWPIFKIRTTLSQNAAAICSLGNSTNEFAPKSH